MSHCSRSYLPFCLYRKQINSQNPIRPFPTTILSFQGFFDLALLRLSSNILWNKKYSSFTFCYFPFCFRILHSSFNSYHGSFLLFSSHKGGPNILPLFSFHSTSLDTVFFNPKSRFCIS